MQHVTNDHRQMNPSPWKGWKQPIPTSIYGVFGQDLLVLNLYIHLLLHTRNEGMEYEEWYEGKPYKLDRGQVLFGKKRYAQYLHCSPSSACNALKRLRERFGFVDTKPCKDYTIVTWKNYDELIRFSTPTGQQTNTEKTAPVTYKNDKNEQLHKSVGAHAQYDEELNELAEICETVFGHQKRVTPEVARNYTERRKIFGKEEIQQAFKNILNEGDHFKLDKNISRSLDWWLASDSRIEDMLHCHLNRPPAKQ